MEIIFVINPARLVAAQMKINVFYVVLDLNLMDIFV